MKTNARLLMYLAVILASNAAPVRAGSPRFIPNAINVYFGGGANSMNRHGHSVFRSVQFELLGRAPLVDSWVTNSEVGVALKYSDVRQARSWFGYRDGDPDDSVRAESSFFFIRKHVRPLYLELGTGPMWSNRRVPAATSRFNFESQVGIGASIGSDRRFPLTAAYRFSHISNGGLAGRNPGLNVHSFMVGTRLFNVLRRGPAALLRSSTPP